MLSDRTDKEEVVLFVRPQKAIDSTLRGSNSEEEVETLVLLFQTGYLTIKGKEYAERTMWYTLNFPRIFQIMR
jgi:hypothetical protein